MSAAGAPATVFVGLIGVTTPSEPRAACRSKSARGSCSLRPVTSRTSSCGPSSPAARRAVRDLHLDREADLQRLLVRGPPQLGHLVRLQPGHRLAEVRLCRDRRQVGMELAEQLEPVAHVAPELQDLGERCAVGVGEDPLLA